MLLFPLESCFLFSVETCFSSLLLGICLNGDGSTPILSAIVGDFVCGTFVSEDAVVGEVWDDIFGITDAGTFDFGDCIPLDKAFSFEFLLGVLTSFGGPLLCPEASFLSFSSLFFPFSRHYIPTRTFLGVF